MENALNCPIGLHEWQIVTLGADTRAMVCLRCGAQEALELDQRTQQWV